MPIVLRVLAAVFAFAIGVGTVAGLESLISRLEPGKIPPVLDRFYDYDLEGVKAKETLLNRLDFNLSGIRLGSMERDVINTLGKPMSIVPADTDPSGLRTLHYRGLDIRFSEDDGERTVDTIEILSPQNAFQGVTIGTSVDEALDRLGRHYRYSSENSFEYDSFVKDGRVMIYHDGSKITGIMTEVAGC